jgi:cytochrome oxidase Cu insertion factor (SCO1/SenC/PrrC family)
MKPKRLPSIHFRDQNGDVFTNEHLKGQPSLLVFGYTSCTSRCPGTLKRLPEGKRVLFVSVDPKETTESLKAYADKVPGMTALRGNCGTLLYSFGYPEFLGHDVTDMSVHPATIFELDENGMWIGSIE